MSERATRGKSRPGRLALLDTYLLLRERPLLGQDQGGPVVDLGFGAVPWTTLELAGALAQVNPALPLRAVDIDPERVRHAQEHARPGLEFVEGGFQLAGPVRLIRAMNVLRQYRPEQVAPAHQAMGAALCPGGLLAEGSSSKSGGVLSASLLRRTPAGLERQGLLLATNFDQGFAPLMFRRRLPRDLERDPAVLALLHQWQQAWQQVQGAPGHGFAASVELLARRRADVDPDPDLAAAGLFLWRSSSPPM